jgi:hypothetical protein
MRPGPFLRQRKCSLVLHELVTGIHLFIWSSISKQEHGERNREIN